MSPLSSPPELRSRESRADEGFTKGTNRWTSYGSVLWELGGGAAGKEASPPGLTETSHQGSARRADDGEVPCMGTKCWVLGAASRCACRTDQGQDKTRALHSQQLRKSDSLQDVAKKARWRKENIYDQCPSSTLYRQSCTLCWQTKAGYLKAHLHVHRADHEVQIWS